MNCKICKQETNLLHEGLFDDRYGYEGQFDIYQCPNCGFGQIYPELGKDQMASLYTNFYPRKNITAEQVKNSNRYRAGKYFKLKSWLMGWDNTCHYQIEPNSKVLDVGCGNGSSLLEIQSQQAEAYGIEEDRNIEPIAKELDLDIFFGSLENSDFPDNSFDYITMSQVLEHIQDPLNFLKLAVNKLSPGGKIIMSFPNKDSFYRVISKEKWINWHVPYHLNFFSEKSLNLLADETGLKIEKIRTITPNCWVALQLRNMREEDIEGEKGKIWHPIETNNRPDVLWASFFHILHYLCIPINRSLDLMKKGDSFLVVFSKE